MRLQKRLLCLLLAACPAVAGPPPPARVEIFTSTRCVTSLLARPGGEIWVGTTGGVLHHSPRGPWQKWTCLEGLPSNEARQVLLREGQVTVVFPQAAATWRGDHWELVAPVALKKLLQDAPAGAAAARVSWQGLRCMAEPAGIRLSGSRRTWVQPLPRSVGAFASALLPHGDTLWAAMYGDGVWGLDHGGTWRRVELQLPPQAREITAMAEGGGHLWVGTRREGAWERVNGAWRQHLQPGEPYNHDCEALESYRGSLYASTLEDGLAVLSPQGWTHVGPPAISSDAPRSMVVFQDVLYVRCGNSKLDRFDGNAWAKDIGRDLARRDISAIAADADRLYVGQWGGWSEFDGKNWTAHLSVPGLQGIPITCLCPDGAALWIGTQGHGLAEVDRASGRIRWHDEREGLPDDWITTLQRQGNRVVAGMFNGGLACQDGDHWIVLARQPQENVTALAAAGPTLYEATRTGVWQIDSAANPPRYGTPDPLPGAEAQALLAWNGALWVGARTGIYRIPLPQ